MTIKTEDLKEGYSIFGNKGAVWSNQAHAYRHGEPRTLCGLPMISTNWAQVEKLKEIGCEKCVEIILKEGEKKDEAGK